jgi:hypothetical protein
MGLKILVLGQFEFVVMRSTVVLNEWPNWRFIRRAKELYSWYSFAVGVGTLLVTGVGLAVGGAVWLATAGIPLPLALMAGYCTLVGAVYLAMAPLVYRVLRQTPFVTKPGEDNRPNYAAVRLQHQYSLGPASRLWVDLDPRAFATYDSQAWYETFVWRKLVAEDPANVRIGLPTRSLAAANPPRSGTVSRSQTMTLGFIQVVV